MTTDKLRIHIKNNHASPETFPPTIEGEEVFTITKERFRVACERFPAVAEQVVAFIDWDLEHFTESMETADVIVTWNLPTTNLAKVAPRLKLIHIIGAGVEHLCPMNWVPEGVKVVNNRGVHAAKGGEFGLMSVLMLNNRIPAIAENQRRANWESLYSSPVAGKTLLVIGTGNIGGAAGQQCAKLGMEVIGISRHGKPVEGFNQVLTPKALVEVLPKADFVLMATPLTPETENLLDRQKQSLIKPGAGIINVGRAGTMDYDALVENLNRGHFSGAIIDVFDPEPLPLESPLWTTPNLLVMPHISADDGNTYVEMTLDLVFQNLERHLNGHELINVVRPELGY
jgi:phosphoglycerate dehydrogenase-like enzyme